MRKTTAQSIAGQFTLPNRNLSICVVVDFDVTYKVFFQAKPTSSVERSQCCGQRVDGITRLLEKALIKFQKLDGNSHVRSGGGGWEEAMSDKNLRYGFTGTSRYIDQSTICSE